MSGEDSRAENPTVPADWYADESFWSISYSFMFSEQAFETAIGQVEKIIELTGVRSGAVFDQCCGPGRHTVPLAKRGFKVTGVDRTGFLLEKARAYAEAEGVEVELVAEDMRRFVRPGAFDLALNLLTSFGYFDDPAENQTVVENVYRSLKPGGVFLLDTVGKEVLARIFQPTGSDELEGGGLLVQRRKVIEGWRRIENEWLFIAEGEVRTRRLRHWLYSAQELRQLVAAAGFTEVEFFGNFDGAPYDSEASRMIAVARKV